MVPHSLEYWSRDSLQRSSRSGQTYIISLRRRPASTGRLFFLYKARIEVRSSQWRKFDFSLIPGNIYLDIFLSRKKPRMVLANLPARAGGSSYDHSS